MVIVTSAKICDEKHTLSMDNHAIAKYGGRVADALDKAGNSNPSPLLTALQSSSGPGTDAFQVVRNLFGCLRLGIAAPGTMKNLTVGRKLYGP